MCKKQCVNKTDVTLQNHNRLLADAAAYFDGESQHLFPEVSVNLSPFPERCVYLIPALLRPSPGSWASLEPLAVIYTNSERCKPAVSIGETKHVQTNCGPPVYFAEHQ